MRWTVGTKIGTGFGLALLILVLIGAASHHNTDKMTDTADWVTHTHLVLEKLDGVIQALTDAETGQRGFIIANQDSFLAPYVAGLAVVEQDVKDVRNLTVDNPHEQQRMDVLEPLVQSKLAFLQEGVDLVKTKGADAARQFIATGKGRQEMDAIRKVIGDARDEELALLKQRNDDAQASARTASFTIIFGILGALVLLSSASFLITRNIAKPLGQITTIAERIAAGDLSVRVNPSQRRDEVGVLAQSFFRMSQSLRDQIRDLTEGVSVLTSSASQISSSTTQLVSSAAETATAVAQTTSTVEQVRQTAQLASQKSKSVSDSAQNMAQISRTGMKATEETVQGIGNIRRQMDTIADTMGRLGEQSQLVSQIIAAVDDLAAQSNLLAVNASIEAARAGEQGKGFAVVAQEVRSLAEQSRQATNQVRTIIADIQRATTAAVMATEQGGKAVDVGVKQVGQAGQSIQTLSSGLTDAAQAATQIAASSQQQLVGVDQVASAMENIKQASSQNAASAKQLEGAAHGLKQLGDKLKQTVEKYRV